MTRCQVWVSVNDTMQRGLITKLHDTESEWVLIDMMPDVTECWMTCQILLSDWCLMLPIVKWHDAKCEWALNDMMPSVTEC